MKQTNYDCDICKKVYHIETEYEEMTEIAQSYFAICDIDFHKGMVCQNCYSKKPKLAKEIDNFLNNSEDKQQ